MPRVLDDLRREVVRRPAHRVGAARHLLGQPKVRDLHVAAGVDQEVLRLEVSVDDLQLREVVEGQGELADVEPRPGLRQLPLVLQQRVPAPEKRTQHP